MRAERQMDACDRGLAALRATRLVWKESERPFGAAVVMESQSNIFNVHLWPF